LAGYRRTGLVSDGSGESQLLKMHLMASLDVRLELRIPAQLNLAPTGEALAIQRNPLL